jgi:hypothetical protein
LWRNLWINFSKVFEFIFFIQLNWILYEYKIFEYTKFETKPWTQRYILGWIEGAQIKTPGVLNGHLVLPEHALWMLEILDESVMPADSSPNSRFWAWALSILPNTYSNIHEYTVKKLDIGSFTYYVTV